MGFIEVFSVKAFFWVSEWLSPLVNKQTLMKKPRLLNAWDVLLWHCIILRCAFLIMCGASFFIWSASVLLCVACHDVGCFCRYGICYGDEMICFIRYVGCVGCIWHGAGCLCRCVKCICHDVGCFCRYLCCICHDEWCFCRYLVFVCRDEGCFCGYVGLSCHDVGWCGVLLS